VFPKLISIGSFYLPTYGVMVALAFLAGLAITVKLARRSGLNAELITNLAVYVALAGMLGAKILMIVFDWGRYMANPGDVFSLATLQAAGVFQGGLILALATAYVYMRKQRLPLLATSDAFAPGLALGHAIGKVRVFLGGTDFRVSLLAIRALARTRPDHWSVPGNQLREPVLYRVHPQS
jgi:phosphatidylglycerol:prolipoprotein diacylglycerol transferase